jgi:hypothetical protein
MEPPMIAVKDGKVCAETRTISAVIERGWLTSLTGKATGEQFVEPFDPAEESALKVVYPGGEEFRTDGVRVGGVFARSISDTRAEIRFHSWNADGVIEISEDEETGDLIIEPSAYSSRPGVLACRWSLRGLRRDLQLVAPLWQGMKVELDDPLNRGARHRWPSQWEAGLAILEGNGGGFWVHCRDTAYRYKALKFGGGADPRGLSLDTDACGPLEDNLASGGLAWRINVFEGDWRAPASAYRDWLWEAFGLEREAARRPDWLHEVRFALSWCPTDPDILDALATVFEPGRVLLHFPHWRTHRYDQNYPTYEASAEARAFLARGREMGFHIAPHFNSLEIDPSHEVYPLLRDFEFRGAENARLMGWSYERGQVLGVPESNAARVRGRDWNTMVKIHPGLAMWRSILGEAVQKAADDLSLEAAFIDVTLNTFNLRQGIVDGMTPAEGVQRVIEYVAGIGGGLAVGGEGRNEVTMQGLSFAQAHLFGYSADVEGLERTGGCPLNTFLFGDLCRTIGYSRLSGRTEYEALRMRIHEEHGAIPTLTIRSAEEILNPNPAAQRVLDHATEG